MMNDKFPKIQKSIQDFFDDEDGSITRNKMLMIGGMVILLGILLHIPPITQVTILIIRMEHIILILLMHLMYRIRTVEAMVQHLHQMGIHGRCCQIFNQWLHRQAVAKRHR